MKIRKDITGLKIGKLTVLEPAFKDNKGCIRWKCLCECGNYSYFTTNSLIQKFNTNCGCLKHNDSKKQSKYYRLYRIWAAMIQRTTNKNIKGSENYVLRGITICDEWRKDYKAFKKWSLENGYQDDLSIDRINNDGNYEPSNCRWATFKQQMNNMSTNHLLTINGITHNCTEWAKIKGISADLLRHRLYKNWPENKLFDPPSDKRKSKKVIQKDLQNNFIKEWESSRQIQKELKFDHNSINKCCKKIRKQAYGYIWEYKEED